MSSSPQFNENNENNENMTKYDQIVNIEDVLEDHFVTPINYNADDETADYIIKGLTDFNNSVAVKQSLRYIPYNDLHTGYNNLHFMKDNKAVLPGKEQLDSSPLFNILKQMPKGAQHHAHLYTFIDYPKIIKYILDNQDGWEDNLYICTDPNSNYYLQPLMLPNSEDWRNIHTPDPYSSYENGLLNPPIKSETIVFNAPEHTKITSYTEENNKKIKLLYTNSLIIDNSKLNLQIEGLTVFELDNNIILPDLKILNFASHINISKGTNSTEIYKSALQQLYEPTNYRKAFFIKLTNINFKPLCLEKTVNEKILRPFFSDNINELFPECESVPSCIYEMLAFSQPFYDLWINIFIRQNVFEGENNNSEKPNKDYPTKWDLLERATEIGGSLTKHYMIFPYFFALTLLNAYYDDNLRIIEFRTPLGNIYKNGQKDGKYERQKINFEDGYVDHIVDEFTKINDEFCDDNILINSDFYKKDNKAYGVDFKTKLKQKFKNGLYQLMLMETIAFVTNILITQDENITVNNIKEVEQTSPNSNNSKEHILETIIGMPGVEKSVVVQPRSCEYIGSKFKNTSDKIDNILEKILNYIKSNIFEKYTLTNENLKIENCINSVTGIDETTKQITTKQIITDKIKNNNLPINYVVIGATAKAKLVNKVMCNNILLDISYIYLISVFLQKYKYLIPSSEVSSEVPIIPFRNFILYPKRITGYDLYGEEDIHHTDAPYEKILLFFKELSFDNNIKWNYFFHAGENHNYIEKHSNLLVSILLDSKRIGHGIRIIGSKALMELVKSKGICIECCPISNQVLDYTPNLSFHPALFYINNGMAVSISTDDQNLYGYDSLAYDYTAIVTSWNLNLTQLKKLVENSLRYSSYNVSLSLYKEFTNSWNHWVKNILNENVNITDVKEQLLITEYINLKTKFNTDDNYIKKNSNVKLLIKGLCTPPNECGNENITIKNLFNKYLTNDFIANIKSFFGETNDNINFFSDVNWYKKCQMDIEKNFDNDNLQPVASGPLYDEKPGGSTVTIEDDKVPHEGGANTNTIHRKKSLKYKKQITKHTRRKYKNTYKNIHKNTLKKCKESYHNTTIKNI